MQHLLQSCFSPGTLKQEPEPHKRTMENLKEKLPYTRKKPRAVPGSYEGNPTVVGQVKEEEGRAGRRKRERNRHMHSIKCINHDLVIYRFKCEGLPEY